MLDAIRTPMGDEILAWLQRFYSSQCDGEWERAYGISIENTSNPGWAVKIDLRETALEGKPMERIDRLRTDNDWVICLIKENVFIGSGGPLNLTEVLSIFKEWVESQRP